MDGEVAEEADMKAKTVSRFGEAERVDSWDRNAQMGHQMTS
jgi:hypothetical protein